MLPWGTGEGIWVGRWALTFLELDLQDIRVVGSLGRVLGFGVQAWRCLVLGNEGVGGVGGQELSREPSHATPFLDTPGPSLSSTPGCGRRAPAGPVVWVPHTPRPSPPAPLARGLGNKGWENQTIFPLNLISSLPSTPPQLEAE